MNPNIWNYKPWWCQPWSMLLVGTAIIAGGWGLTRNLWVILGLSIVIGLWWGYFLLLNPYLFKKAVMAEAIEEKPGD